jgi:hypothetical protein
MTELTESWLIMGRNSYWFVTRIISRSQGEFRRSLDFLGIEISAALLDDIVAQPVRAYGFREKILESHS